LLDLDLIDTGDQRNPGVAKNFLAKFSGWRACQSKHRVLFTAAVDMLNHLRASQDDHPLIRKLRVQTEPALLIVDDPPTAHL
jgi:DNA replication protein DnaC